MEFLVKLIGAKISQLLLQMAFEKVAQKRAFLNEKKLNFGHDLAIIQIWVLIFLIFFLLGDLLPLYYRLKKIF